MIKCVISGDLVNTKHLYNIGQMLYKSLCILGEG